MTSLFFDACKDSDFLLGMGLVEGTVVVGCRGHWKEEGERQGWVNRVCVGGGRGRHLRVEF